MESVLMRTTLSFMFRERGKANNACEISKMERELIARSMEVVKKSVAKTRWWKVLDMPEANLRVDGVSLEEVNICIYLSQDVPQSPAWDCLSKTTVWCKFYSVIDALIA